MSGIKGTGDYSDFNGRDGRLGKFQFRGPYAREAYAEATVHAESVHDKASVAERQIRERTKAYEQAKRELAEARAASGQAGRLPL